MSSHWLECYGECVLSTRYADPGCPFCPKYITLWPASASCHDAIGIPLPPQMGETMESVHNLNQANMEFLSHRLHTALNLHSVKIEWLFTLRPQNRSLWWEGSVDLMCNRFEHSSVPNWGLGSFFCLTSQFTLAFLSPGWHSSDMKRIHLFPAQQSFSPGNHQLHQIICTQLENGRTRVFPSFRLDE